LKGQALDGKGLKSDKPSKGQPYGKKNVFRNRPYIATVLDGTGHRERILNEKGLLTENGLPKDRPLKGQV